MAKQGQPAANLVERKQPGFESIIEIGRVVSNLIGDIDKLGFKRRTKIEQVLGEFGMQFRLIIVRMLNDALANFERQVEPAEGGITQLKVFHDAQCMQVVVERKPMLTHGHVEGLFTSMAKRRMAHVMHQSKSLNQVDIQAKLRGNGSRDLRDFKGVGQTIAKMIGMAASKNLGL